MSPDATVADALSLIQSAEEIPESAFYVYVAARDGRLVGVISLRRLVISRPNQRVSEIMQPDIHSVQTDTDQEEVAELVSRYDLVALPVVDAHHRIVGIIEVDDVVDVIARGGHRGHPQDGRRR